MREGGREGRGVSLTLWEVLEDSGEAALGEQENVAVSLGPHCATAGDIVNQVEGGGVGMNQVISLGLISCTYIHIYIHT